MISSDLSFVILCPSMNYGGLRTTISTIKSSFQNASSLVAVGDNMDKNDIVEIKKTSRTVVAKPTVTAMINKGIEQSEKSWTCIVTAGSYVRYEALKRYDNFITKETDIGYPIVDLKFWRFEESSLNGFFVHKKTFAKVGPFAENEHNLEIIRLFWALDAAEKGCQIKGVVGVKIC